MRCACIWWMKRLVNLVKWKTNIIFITESIAGWCIWLKMKEKSLELQEEQENKERTVSCENYPSLHFIINFWKRLTMTISWTHRFRLFVNSGKMKVSPPKMFQMWSPQVYCHIAYTCAETPEVEFYGQYNDARCSIWDFSDLRLSRIKINHGSCNKFLSRK